jgi:hypothetical protein
MMEQTIEALIVVSISGLTLVALFSVVSILFSRLVSDGKKVAERMPGRSLVLGLVNLSFLSAVFLVSYALGDNLNAPVLYVPGILALASAAVGAVFGLTSVVELIGEQFSAERSRTQRALRGGALLILACLCPFIGWFVLLPYVVMVGFGASIIGFLQRFQKSTSRVDIPTEGEMNED